MQAVGLALGVGQAVVELAAQLHQSRVQRLGRGVAQRGGERAEDAYRWSSPSRSNPSLTFLTVSVT